jgi:hypothetical protein
MKNLPKPSHRLAWIEACLRYAGRFGPAEKKAYRERFDLTEGMVSRDQFAVLQGFVRAGLSKVVEKQHGKLFHVEGTSLPEEPVFRPLPIMSVWLAEMLGPRFENVPFIQRSEPSQTVLRAVVRAISEKRTLGIEYRPRKGMQRWRSISPHCIVQADGRLHLRAWDHSSKTSGPRDFVLSRIVAVNQDAAGHRFVDQKNDLDWNRFVVVEVRMRDGENVQAVAPDYGLDEYGIKTVRMRAAHAFYVLDKPSDVDDRGQKPVEFKLLKAKPETPSM